MTRKLEPDPKKEPKTKPAAKKELAVAKPKKKGKTVVVNDGNVEPDVSKDGPREPSPIAAN